VVARCRWPQIEIRREADMPNVLPLTFQQKWLWNLLQEHSDWCCMVVYTFRLQGALNVGLLESSLAEVIRRHGSLRTRIVATGGEVQQQIDEPRAYELRSVPVDGLSGTEIDATARRFVEAFCDVKIDPAVGPWLNVRLLKLSDSEHWLVLAMHRLIADCSSMDQVARELWLLYGEFLHGRPTPLAADPAQYADYAVWQRELNPEWLQKHASYWQGRLAGAAHIRWPVDEFVAGTSPGALGRMSRLFDSELSTELREFARRARTLLANVMLSVYVAVLWRWCKQANFIVPFKVAGRHSEHKSVVGYFTQILYLRMELSGKETFSELLSHVSSEFFRALSHQDFGRIATQNPELLAGTLFQWVTWHPEQVLGRPVPRASDFSELKVERVSLADFGEDHTALPAGVVDVEVTLFDTTDGIYASGVYRADRYSASTMERFMGDLRSAAEEFVRDPHALVTICDRG
jgi:hypothetical protein